MGLFSRRSSDDSDDDKLPLFAFRGLNEETGERENYLLRWGCQDDDECEGLFRSLSQAAAHDTGHRKGGEK